MKKKKTKRYYNWDVFITQCRYYTSKRKKPPHHLMFVGPDSDKISKEVDNELS